LTNRTAKEDRRHRRAAIGEMVRASDCEVPMWRRGSKASERGPGRGVALQKVHGPILLLALAVAITAACGPSASPEQTVPSDAVDPSPTVTTEDPNGVESPAAGDAGFSVQLAGLPIGGGSASVVGDAWCQLLSWNADLPSGVTIDVDAVRLQEQGAQLLPGGCDSTPSCVGTVIDAGSPTCAVLVKPDPPETPSVTVQLDGTLRCPDEQTCDDLRASGGGSFSIQNPGGGEFTDDGATPAGTADDDGAGSSAAATPEPTG
jgi:hypothetical protein